MGVQSADGVSGKIDFTGARCFDAGDGADQRGFAGAVGADDGNDATSVYFQARRDRGPERRHNRGRDLLLRATWSQLSFLAEITFEHAWVAHDGFRRTGGDHFAVVQHDDLFCQCHHRAHDMLDNHKRHAVALMDLQ